jgi:hypothetical protein
MLTKPASEPHSKLARGVRMLRFVRLQDDSCGRRNKQNMNWDAISAIGEILGTAAVAVSLVYLGLQLRDQRRSAEAQGTLSSTELYSKWRTSVLANSDLSSTLSKANSKLALDGGERIQLQLMSDELILSAASSFANSNRSGALHTVSGEVDYLVSILKLNPGLIPEWQRLKPIAAMIDSRFANAVEERLVG